MVLCIIQLETINTFSKVVGYEISLHKLIVSMHTNHKHIEKEIIDTLLFPIAANTIKYLVVKVTNKVKDLHNGNFKSLKNETEKDTRKWEEILSSKIGRINIVKMTILQKQFTDIMHSPSNIHAMFLKGIEKNHKTHVCILT